MREEEAFPFGATREPERWIGMFSNVGLPHGWCFFWQPGLLWLHVVSDSLIALAYLLIPVALLRIIRGRPDIPFNGVALCFGAFIIACGGTHIMEVYTLWHPVYWVSGWLKAFTAVVSLATLGVLIYLTPAILRFPSSDDVKRLNDRLNSVLESTTDGVMTVGFDWKILYANRVTLETNPGIELIGKPFWETYPVPPGSPEDMHIHRAMRDRTASSYETYYPPYDKWFDAHVYPSSDGITIFFADVTLRKRLETQIEKEKALREQRIEGLSHMAGGLAHEINNPLSIIQARASDLGELATEAASVPSEAVAKACESIVRTTNRAIRILKGLHGFAREGSKDPMHRASLYAIADQSIELVQRRFQTHNIYLRVSSEANIPDIECREVQVSQIMLNLLNNAFDAVDSVAAGKAPAPERWVSLKMGLMNGDGPQQIWVEVVDSGPGIDEKFKAHLMEPFFTTKPVGAGLGVGLSLSRAIAQDHHGSLSLIGEEKHTCFRLVLPVTQPPAEASIQAS